MRHLKEVNEQAGSFGGLKAGLSVAGMGSWAPGLRALRKGVGRWLAPSSPAPTPSEQSRRGFHKQGLAFTVDVLGEAT